MLEAAAFNFAFGGDHHSEAIEGEVFACDDVACRKIIAFFRAEFIDFVGNQLPKALEALFLV